MLRPADRASAPDRVRGRVEEGHDLVAQVVGARVVGAGDVAGVRARCRRPPSAAARRRAERTAAWQAAAERHRGTTSAQLVSTHSREKLTLSR